ncbi:CvpA family protein [Thiospirochaeta perfilievii]|uniref:CvpA family protein n=1 Tax=Thiospirochaeta perfilievii TaxID=252967 RepID=A0A5C1QH37_9SPIO|nr:CvpA family protein [Thiospirochaeta perfilievii]QEN06310.1 CvpA family protein [Thiospirochaeta perfilievii]
MSFKLIDIIFIIIILLMGFGGLKKGFFTQIVTILGLIIGLFFAYFFSDDLSPYISKVIGERPSNTLLSFILIFLVSILISMLINKILKHSLEEIGAGGLDKVLGLFFGFIQGFFICIIVTLLLTVQPLFDPSPIFNNSVLGSLIVSILPQIESLLPSTQSFIESIGTEV